MERKKYLMILSFFACIVVFCGLALAGCNNKYYALTKENIAEERHNLFVGESENISATFMCGYREEDYVINGYNTTLIPFGVVTVEVKSENITKNDSASYSLLIGTNRYDGIMEQNPFDGTYVADIKQLITISDDLTLDFTLGSFSQKINLKNISDSWQVTYDQALKIACDELKPFIKSMTDNTFLGETYIKIIYDNKIQENSYFWYVNFVGRKGESHSIIIHPVTGEILAKK